MTSGYGTGDGSLNGMRTTIDNAGRVVVPKAMRDRLGLTGGTELDIVEVDGVIEITPAPIPAQRIITEHGSVIAAPSVDVPIMTDADVREALEDVRR